LATACAVVPEAPPAPPARADEPGAFLSRLVADQTGARSLRGLASIRYDGPSGSGSANQVIVVSLPDRARLETVSPLGMTVFVMAIRGDELRFHAPDQQEYGVGRATAQTLGRLIRVPIPPGPLLRLLSGLPPLPMRADDPRVVVAGETGGIRVESVDGPFWQRLWTGPERAEVVRGELGEASGPLLAFSFGDRRLLGDVPFPFTVRMEAVAAGSRLAIQYQTVRLNEPLEGEVFELPRPANARIRSLEPGPTRP
jgi:hypothetical protein